MWAGTNAGYVFIYQIHLPSDERRHTDTVDCVLGESLTRLKFKLSVEDVCQPSQSITCYMRSHIVTGATRHK